MDYPPGVFSFPAPADTGRLTVFGEQVHRTTSRTETIEETPVIEPWAFPAVGIGDSIRTGVKSGLVVGVLVLGVGVVLAAQDGTPAGYWAAGVFLVLAAIVAPAALDVLAAYETQALMHRTRRRMLQADLLRAETALTTRRYRLVTVEAEQSQRLALVAHREVNRSQIATEDDAADLLRFVAAVYLRGETAGARRWTGSAARLPSGRTYRADDWQTRLVLPCLEVGALTPPSTAGTGYKPADGFTFGRTVKALQAAGRLPPQLALPAPQDTEP